MMMELMLKIMMVIKISMVDYHDSSDGDDDDGNNDDDNYSLCIIVVVNHSTEV